MYKVIRETYSLKDKHQVPCEWGGREGTMKFFFFFRGTLITPNIVTKVIVCVIKCVSHVCTYFCGGSIIWFGRYLRFQDETFCNVSYLSFKSRQEVSSECVTLPKALDCTIITL